MYGEPVEVLLEALLKLHAGMEEEPDGSFRMQATFPPQEGEALWRALMRAEAALMRKDADAFPVVDRSDADRQSAALVALALQVTDASQRLGIRASVTPRPPGATLATCRPAGRATS